MRRRVAMLSLATVVLTAMMAAIGTAAGGPPPPTSTSGATVQLVATGLGTPTSFAFGGGAIFEGDGGNSQSGPPNGGVFALANGAGTKLAGSPNFVAGLVWHGSTLYVSGGTVTGPTSVKWQILAWSGWNGTAFATKSVLWTAPSKLNGLNGLGFGPDGRLYVGVDVGLTNNNDHGPASLTPYLYDILSFAPTGKDMKVFATGIRQPWQMIFPAGSKTPLVSDLGQDKGAKNPPDFLLSVHKGDDYGFPGCNRTSAGKCKGFAKPLREFAPHTDIMGLAIIGKELYMTSFQGLNAKGPGGEVVSSTLEGGSVKPVLTGFVAPTVGLGANGGTLYVGEASGQVYSVTP